MDDVTIIILAAGQGTRMCCKTPKVLHKIAGLSLLGHVVAMAQKLLSDDLGLSGDIWLVLSPENGTEISQYFPNIPVHIQKQYQGTGGALKSFFTQQDQLAQEGVGGNRLGKKILVLYGDTPFIDLALAQKLLQATGDAGLAVLGFDATDPGSYGRIILAENNTKNRAVDAIIEAKELSAEQQNIRLCNGGIMAMITAQSRIWLSQLSNQNATGEYYLTDLVALARQQGDADIQMVKAFEEQVMGVNSLLELANAEKLWQQQKRAQFMANGVMMQDPESIFFSYDTKIAANVTLQHHIHFGIGVEIAEYAHIKSFCHIEGAKIGAHAQIGPLARLRPQTQIGEHAAVGNFVEVKNSCLDSGVKAGHLAYLGDAKIGSDSNIGAGTITCNYDGCKKEETLIGKNVFVGSNSALIAPIVVGDDALIAAGSVITKDVVANELATARGVQKNLANHGMKYRRKKELSIKGKHHKGKT